MEINNNNNNSDEIGSSEEEGEKKSLISDNNNGLIEEVSSSSYPAVTSDFNGSPSVVNNINDKKDNFDKKDNCDKKDNSDYNDEENNDDDLMNSGEKKRKNRPGRASRRRKAKLRSIEEIEKRLWDDYNNNKKNKTDNNNDEKTNNNTLQVENDNVLPIDRSLDLWKGVLERRQELSSFFSKEDQMMLMGQLGYIPGNAVAIVARSHQYPQLCLSHDNIPLVLQLYPLALRHAYEGGKSDGRKFKSRKRGKNQGEGTIIEPFPTMYWLTHPLLRILTSKLEVGKDHNVKSMEERLVPSQKQDHDDVDDNTSNNNNNNENNNNIIRMKEAHESYSKVRWDLLTDDDQYLLKTDYPSYYSILQPHITGIAGIRLSDRNHSKVKCLHTHLAHYLSNGPGSSSNLVGQWVMEEICKLIQQQRRCQVCS